MTPSSYRLVISSPASNMSLWLIHATLLMAILFALSTYAKAGPIRTGETLPPMEITVGGKIILEDSDYLTAPWAGPVSIPMVQVYQYVPGTRKGGSLYDPLTERLCSRGAVSRRGQQKYDQDLPAKAVRKWLLTRCSVRR